MARGKSVSKSRKPKQIKERRDEKPTKRIDIGKIMALKRARWTDEDIAAEMRMEPTAVAKSICQCLDRCQAEGGL